jgi:hypothetical protein
MLFLFKLLWSREKGISSPVETSDDDGDAFRSCASWDSTDAVGFTRPMDGSADTETRDPGWESLAAWERAGSFKLESVGLG